MRTIWRTGLWACCWVAGPAVGVQGAQFILKPVRASGTYTIVGNEIRLTGVPQRVFLEIQLKGWAPNLLKTYQAKIDCASYSGITGDLAPASQACAGANDTGDAQCAAALGSGDRCNIPPDVGQFCEPGWIDKFRGDFVFFNGDIAVTAVDLSTCYYRYTSVLNPGRPKADPGIAKYGGNLVLDVPAGATGDYTISFAEGSGVTLMADENNNEFDLDAPIAAKITILCTTNANCNDNSACTTDICNANGTCSHTNNYNVATDCCNPANGVLTVLSDGIQCTDDLCNTGNGQVTHPNSSVNTPCGNGLNSQCDKPDSCDGAGHCLARLEPVGTPCGSSTDTECNGADACDGTGVCVTNIRSAGTPCGDHSDTACDNPDTCNGLGLCVPNTEPNGLACSDGLFCTVGERCSTALCTGGTPKDCADLLTCTTDTCNEGADRCDHVLQAGKCLIDGVCYLAGDLRPTNTCETCDPTQSGTSWTVLPNASLCNDGNACTGTGRPGIGFDTCTGGVCSGLPDVQCNDQCEFAVPVIVGVNTSDNSSAGVDDGEASCQPDSNHDVWFKFTASCNGITFASTTGSALAPSNDTVLSVYSKCPLNGGTELACDDDSGVGLQSALNFSTTIGTTYLLRVAGFENNKGPIVLNIRPVDDCLIDGVCYGDGDHNPANECQACIPQVSSTQWSPRAEGSACGNHADTECDSPDACDGAGICEVNFKPNGIPCSDEVPANVCTKNFCQTGLCTHPPEPAGLACGDPSDTDCDNPDTCDGGGGCAPNLEGAGHACGDPSDSQCNHPDTCDGGGGCLNNLAANGTACDDVDYCTANDKCLNGLCVGTPSVLPPTVEGLSSRSLRVTPHTALPEIPVALLVTSPTWPCLHKYVAEDGRLAPVSGRVFQFPFEWGSIIVQDPDIFPSSIYFVQEECGAYLSQAGVDDTFRWGDINNDGRVDVIDIDLIVLNFKGIPGAPSIEACDVHPCVPNGIINALDITMEVAAVKGAPYYCSPPCH
jgi:hypothetical protein